MINTNITLDLNLIPKLNYNEKFSKTTEFIHSSHIIYKEFIEAGKNIYDFISFFNSCYNNYKNEFMNRKLYFDKDGYLCLDYYKIVKIKHNIAIKKAFDYFKLNSN